MPIRPLIYRVRTFLKSKIVAKPKDQKQTKRDWLFTLTNNKVNVYGPNRQVFGDKDHLVEITSPNHCQLLVRYSSKIGTEDLEILIETLKNWGQNLVVSQEPMVRAKIEAL